MIDFRKKILKVNESRSHKISGSLGVYDSYKWIRKNKWLNIERPLKEHEFYSIIRKVNEYLADNLLEGHDILLPHRMGRLELKKRLGINRIVNGKLVSNLPIDWDTTLKLWYEDEESYNNKTLIRLENDEIFKCYYNKNIADYTNKSFYQFSLNREIKLKLKQKIKRKELDAFEQNYG